MEELKTILKKIGGNFGVEICRNVMSRLKLFCSLKLD